MSKTDEVWAQLELLADFQDKAIRARIKKANAEKFESGPYPEGTETVHRLKITLRKVRPPVWRRIEVASDTTLGELSPMLEGVMGWYGGHLHAFDIGGTDFSPPDPDWDTGDLDENKYRLGAVLSTVGSKMGWATTSATTGSTRSLSRRSHRLIRNSSTRCVSLASVPAHPTTVAAPGRT